jgi:hypothetical protein
MGQKVAGQSLCRIVSRGRGGKRQGYRATIDPIASELSCRACIDLRSIADLASCTGSFLREQSFHDLLKQKPTSLFIWLGWSSIAMASQMMWSMYWVLVVRMEVHTRSTRRHIPEDGILHSHRCENLKSYIRELTHFHFTVHKRDNFTYSSFHFTYQTNIYSLTDRFVLNWCSIFAGFIIPLHWN